MPSAGSDSISTEERIYDDVHGCTSFLIGCEIGSSVSALVNVHGLHDNGEYFPIAAGKEYVFRVHDYGIKKVDVKGDGGTADIYFGVVARTLKN